MPDDRFAEHNMLGQFIPVHYHHNMLMDENRMKNFRAAIDHAVFPGAKVLELGGGTGVLSWFAAAKASKVWCVEFNPEMVQEAKKMLARNRNGEKVEVVHADAMSWLPPEPVDVVICEMIHVAMLREKQVEVIEAFKSRYQRRFGGRLPVFIPEAVIMAVQPVQQDCVFEGFEAPIIQFQNIACAPERTRELAPPTVYSLLDFSQKVSQNIGWSGQFLMEQDGEVNALRFLTKNVLTVDLERATTIDWCIHHLVLPLEEPVEVRMGDFLDVSFEYRAGASIPSLQTSIRAQARQVMPGALLARKLACA